MNASKRLDWAPLFSAHRLLQRATPCRQRSFHSLVHRRRILSSSSVHRSSLMSHQMLSTNVDMDRGDMTAYQSAIMHLNSLQSNAVTILKMRQSRDAMQEKNVAMTTEFLKRCGITISFYFH